MKVEIEIVRPFLARCSSMAAYHEQGSIQEGHQCGHCAILSGLTNVSTGTHNGDIELLRKLSRFRCHTMVVQISKLRKAGSSKTEPIERGK